MKYKFPIEFIKENIIFTENNCYAGFKFGGFEYTSKTTNAKKRILNDLKELIKDIPSEAQILLVPRKISCDEALLPMINKVKSDDPLKGVSTFLMEETIRVLSEREQDIYVYDDLLEENKLELGIKEVKYDNYIFILIKEDVEGDFITKGSELLEYGLKEPVEALNRLLGVSDKYISENRFKLLKKKANEFLESQKNYIDIRSVSKKEIDDLVTRITKRGHESADEKSHNNINNMLVNENGDEIIVPKRDAYKNRVEGAIKQGNRLLKIEHEDFTSYQSFVSFIDIPNLEFPGGEFIKQIQQEYPGAELCIHIKKYSTEESKRKLSVTDKKIASQINEACEGGHEVEEEVIEGKLSVEDFKRDIRENKHLVESSITVCLSSIDEKRTKSLSKDMVQNFNKMGFNLVNPLTDQYKLFLEFIPGAKHYTRDYVDLIPMQTLAGSMFGTNDKIGDEQGGYIAYTANGKKVYLYLGRAPQENKSPAMIILGNLGFGKSFNANLILILHVLSGSSAVIFDPKSERGHWKDAFEFMSDLISIVRLTSSDEDKGKLDPFNVYSDNVNEACELALNIICELIGLTPKDNEYVVLKEILIKLKVDNNPSMKRLIELLDIVSNDEEERLKEEAYMLARKLKTMNEEGLSRLMFGDGTEKAINMDNRLNILQIDNLKIPDVTAKKEEYSEEERVSTCLMMVMSSFTKKFAMKKRDTFDVILFDESWFLKNTAEGKKLYEFLTRQGRSLNVGCIFNGHSVLDIPSEEVKNTLTYKLCFHTESEDEAKRMLKLMKMEETKDNIERILKLKNRQALFQDLDGRVDTITFDAIFDTFIDTFNTKPEDTINNNNNNDNESR